MINQRPLPPGDPNNIAGTAVDRRAQVLRAEQERVMERERQIELQSSPMSTPEERIRLWEQLHALQLPRSPTHALLRLIATQTALTLDQVRSEQQRRAPSAGTHSR